MKQLAYISFLCISTGMMAQTKPVLNPPKDTWPEKMAKTMMTVWKDSTASGDIDTKPLKWTYDQGVVLTGIEGLWYRTGDARYFTYIQHSMDVFVTKDGGINTYKLEDYNIDNINCG